MKRFIFVFAVLMLACSVHALSIDAPAEVATNTAFSIVIEFDSLNSFSEATVQLAGSTIVSLYTYNNVLHIYSFDKSRVLAASIDAQELYLLMNGIRSEGDAAIKAEETGTGQKEVTIKVFIPLSKDFEEQYTQQFNSLKNTIMSYANDIDSLKAKIDELNASVSSGQASATELQNKLGELSATLENIKSELAAKASTEQLEENTSGLQQAIDEQAARLSKLEEETVKIPISGLVSFAAIENETNLVIIAAIIIIIAIVILIARGKIPIPSLPSFSGRGSIYKQSKMDTETTSKIIEEAKPEDVTISKWAYMGETSFQPREEKKGKASHLGNLIKKE